MNLLNPVLCIESARHPLMVPNNKITRAHSLTWDFTTGAQTFASRDLFKRREKDDYNSNIIQPYNYYLRDSYSWEKN